MQKIGDFRLIIQIFAHSQLSPAMVKKDNRVDEYIDVAAPFARPILRKLRRLVHKACPDVEETIKWGFIAFEYNGLLATMAAFKSHAVFGFWKYKLLIGTANSLEVPKNHGGTARGNLGRITSIDDLPSDAVLSDFLKQALSINEQGVKKPKKPKKVLPAKVPQVEPPDYLIKALRKSGLLANFQCLPPSHRAEYVRWILEAKLESTRFRRAEKAVEKIASSVRPRN